MIRATRALPTSRTQPARGAVKSRFSVSAFGTSRDFRLQPLQLIHSSPFLFFRSVFVSSALGDERPTRQAGRRPFFRSLAQPPTARSLARSIVDRSLVAAVRRLRRSPVRSRARPSTVRSWRPCAAFVDRRPFARGGLAPPSSIARRVARSIARRSLGRSRRRSRRRSCYN